MRFTAPGIEKWQSRGSLGTKPLGATRFWVVIGSQRGWLTDGSASGDLEEQVGSVTVSATSIVLLSLRFGGG